VNCCCVRNRIASMRSGDGCVNMSVGKRANRAPGGTVGRRAVGSGSGLLRTW
jgi:hypothetical protein